MKTTTIQELEIIIRNLVPSLRELSSTTNSVQLHHVLHAIMVATDYEKLGEHELWMFITNHWDMNKPLDGQSAECHEFLLSILGKVIIS